MNRGAGLTIAAGMLAGVGAVIGAVLYVLPRIEDTTYTFDAPHLKAQLRVAL